MNDDYLRAAAAAIDLPLPADALPGIRSHLERCAAAARLIEEFPMPAETEIAGVFSYERL